MSGGDRGGGAEQVGGDEIGFTAEARRKPGDLTAKGAEGAKEEREKGLPQIYAEGRRWARAVGN